MASFLQILSGAQMLPQLVESLGKAIAGIKSAQGKKDVALFRTEVVRALEQIQEIAEQESKRLALLQSQVILLSEHVQYLSMPFYRRWFALKPPPLDTLPLDAPALSVQREQEIP